MTVMMMRCCCCYRFGQHYDLSRYIEKSVVDAMDIAVWPQEEPPGIGKCSECSVVFRVKEGLHLGSNSFIFIYQGA